MADVFLAVSRSNGGLEKLAVIKRLRPEVAEDAEELEHFKGMFWDEAKLAMLLNHANVVHTYDATDADDSLYIVMEYIEGQSLSTIQRELERKKERLEPFHAAWIMSEVLAGLHHAHDLHDLTGKALTIVHRDVSPQNILVSYDASVKLVDFGVAKASSRSTETRAGTFKGKARYMAPEQILNGVIDRRVDIYAAGAVLWEILARRPLVTGTNTVEQLVNVVKMEPDRLSSVVPDIDPELEAIVHKAISRDPLARFATALEMRDAFVAYVNRVGGQRLPDLAALLGRLFSKRREETSKVIRERLAVEAARDAAADSGMTPMLALDQDRGEGSVPSIHSGARSVAQPVFGTSASILRVPEPTSTPSPDSNRGPKRTIVWLVAVLMLLILVVGVMAGVLVAEKKKPDVVAQPVAPTVASPDAPPTPMGGGAAATVAATPPPAVPTASASAAVVAEGPKPTAPVALAQPALPPRGYVGVLPQAARPKSAAAEAPAAPAPPSDEKSGFVTLDTYPWTKISENGRILGTTPLVGYALSAGTHVLSLDNPQDNVHSTTTIVVKPGETVSKRLAF